MGTKRVEANGLGFRVVDEGEGAAVLLLHGFPDSSDEWRHQVPALVDAGHRVIAPDLRGFGESDAPEGIESYGAEALLARRAGDPRRARPPVACPTLGIWSANDGFLVEEQVIESKEFAPAGWRYERIEGAGHWIPTDAPDQLNALLVDFL